MIGFLRKKSTALLVLLFIVIIILQIMILTGKFCQKTANERNLPDFDPGADNATVEFFRIYQNEKRMPNVNPIPPDPVTQWLIAMKVTKSRKNATIFADKVEALAPHQMLGHTNEMCRQYHEAIECYKMAGEYTQEYATPLSKEGSPYFDQDIARCYYWLGNKEKARLHYALAVIHWYDRTHSGINDETAANRRVFERLCILVIRAPYDLRSPLLDSRNLVSFVEEGLANCPPDEKAVFSKAVSILDDIFGPDGPIVYGTR